MPQVLPDTAQNHRSIEKSQVEIPTEKSIYAVISLDKETLDSTWPEEVPLPLVDDDLIPDDPFLRLIELKKRYHRKNTLTDSPFDDNTVTSIETMNNSYLIGTLRGGVFHYHQDGSFKESIITPSDSIVNRSVTEIITKPDIYIATYAGVFQFDLENKLIQNLTVDMNDRSVLALMNQGEKVYWGTSGGVLYCSHKSQVDELIRIDSSIKAIVSFDDVLLIGGNNGKLFSYKENRITELFDIDNYVGSGGKINDLLVIQSKILILTTNGLWLLNSDFELEDRYLTDQVILDSVMSENYIYMGTHSGGVIIYDKINNRYSVWGLDQGIPSLNIPAMGVVGNEVLLSIPDKGIIIINEEIHEKL